MDEVSVLKQKLEEVERAKGEVEAREASLIREKRAVDGRLLTVLVERAALVTDRDSFAGSVKRLKSKVAELELKLNEKNGELDDLKGEREMLLEETSLDCKESCQLCRMKP